MLSLCSVPQNWPYQQQQTATAMRAIKRFDFEDVVEDEETVLALPEV